MMGAMKLALLADPHANRHALDACLAHARAAGATQTALLGDLVGYGAQPAEVVALAQELAGQGALVLRGNHDDAAVHPPATGVTAEHASAAWTHGRLAPAQRDWLAGLPLTARWHDLLLVHASADQPSRWDYVDRPERAVQCLEAAWEHAEVQRVACGHVHAQRLFYRARRDRLMPFEPTPGVAIPLAAHPAWVATAGSVGQPRDGDVRAMYALYDAQANTLTFHRVDYDHAGAAAAIRRTTLPVYFAERLERGQ
jgi:diadenosine tetraphosphatase ApaH/serine/threonine PP2A family protein phosphatase